MTRISKSVRQGQASLEWLIALALGIALISIIFYATSTYAYGNAQVAEAQDAVNRLGAAADYVHSSGPGSVEYVDVYLPDSTTNISIINKTLAIRISTSSGTSDMVAHTKANLINALPSVRGKQTVLVQSLESGYVLIGQGGLVCSPSTITVVFNLTQPANTTTINLRNTAGFTITGINGTFGGTATEITSITNPPSYLNSGSNATLNVTTNNSHAAGAYSGVYLVQTANAGACTVGINVNVNVEQTCSSLCFAAGYISSKCVGAGGGEGVCSGGDLHPNPGDCQHQCCCMPAKPDASGPVVTANFPSDKDGDPTSLTNTTDAYITASCDDTAHGGSDIDYAEFRINGGSWGAHQQAKNNNDGFDTITSQNFGPLPVGWNEAWIRCTDDAGNTGPISTFLFPVLGS